MNDMTTAAPSVPKARLAASVGTWFAPETRVIFAVTAALFVVSAALAPGTLRLGSLIAMAPFASFLAIVAVGQTLVIRQRGLDMSAGGMMTLAGVILAELSTKTGWMMPAIVFTLLASAAVGAINGFLITRVNISPIVATLAVGALLAGSVRAISGGTPVTILAALRDLTHTPVLGIPLSFVVALGTVIAVAVIVNDTLVGRRYVSVGASAAAAAGSGVRILRYQIGAYIGASLCFGLAGILLAGFVGFASQSAGNDYLLPGIIAVIVGGTQFGGGKGSILASAVAALFMAQLSQLVNSLGASSAVQLLVQAIAIVIAVGSRAGWQWISARRAY